MPTSLKALRSGPLRGRIQVPGDKSISHRALILGALSTGVTTINGLLQAEDVLATAKVLEQLGVPIERLNAEWRVYGRGIGGLRASEKELDFGNSGTGVRLMMGVIAGHPMQAVCTGDVSLCRRPMSRVLKPLKEMGLNIFETDKDTLPLTLQGSSQLIPIKYCLPVPSAQVKSAILLAGLHAPGETTIVEPQPTRDHSERMLRHFGANLSVLDQEDGARAITIAGDGELRGAEVVVPGDPSSAAFMTAAALIVPGSDVTIENVLINPTRFGFYETLLEMGANLTLGDKRSSGGEQVADIRVRTSALKGVTVPADRAPSMIDEYPCLACLAAFAEGETRMLGLGELKVKESDRLAATLAGLSASGIHSRAEGDSLIVTGCKSVPGGGVVRTEHDHRIAMSFLTLGLASEKPVTVDDIGMIATSFPEFTELMRNLGAEFEEAASGQTDCAQRGGSGE